jgi:hypothetical protein
MDSFDLLFLGACLLAKHNDAASLNTAVESAILVQEMIATDRKGRKAILDRIYQS